MSEPLSLFSDSETQRIQAVVSDLTAENSRAMTFDEFSNACGVSTTPPAFPDMHRNPRRPSKSSQRTASRRAAAELGEWGARRDWVRAEYERLTAQGRVRLPTRLERLTRTANGEGSSAEAARRLLAEMVLGVMRAG